MDDVLKRLEPALTNPDVPKTAHNANYDMMVLENHGIKVEGLAFDTMLAAHAAGRSSVGLKNLALDMLGEEMTPITDLIGRGRNQKTMDQVDIASAADYATADADFTERLRRLLEKEVEGTEIGDLLQRYELPLTPVLVRMQRDGVAVDVDLLKEMSAELKTDLEDIRQTMYETVGHEFNLNSSQQLGGVLFDELRLPPTRKTKTGFSTDASSLEGLKAQLDTGTLDSVDPSAYAVLDDILQFRQLSKIKSTYVDALPGLVNPDTGRIHTQVQPDWFCHRSGVVQRSERPEHPGTYRVGTPGQAGLRRTGRPRVDSPGGRLLTDRAAGACSLLQGPFTAGGIPQG